MNVIIVKDSSQLGLAAADIVEKVLDDNPHPVLGLATGSSPLPLYAELSRRKVDCSAVTGFALDNYVGIPNDSPHSYATVLRNEVTDRLGMRPERTHVPNAEALDGHAAARAYEAEITDAGGIDLQVLGIGTNGHIGFNEPTSSFASRTRVAALARSTREANARFFDSLDEVPTHCITQGLGTILEARHLLLLVQGKRKANILAQTIEGPLTSMCPASVIHLHPQATVIADEEAASELRLTDYYRDAQSTKSRCAG